MSKISGGANMAKEEDSCIFCKILKGQIPSAKIYEDEKVYAFLDIMPVNPGHTLVIPKRHVKDFSEMSKQDMIDVFTAAQKVAKMVVEGVGAEGFNLGMNNGQAAGQAVFHAHLHIMPRFSNDGRRLWKGVRYKESQMDNVRRQIANRK